MATLSTPHPRLRQQIGAPKLLQLWHLTSLDAPTVAVVWTIAFARAAHVNLPIWLPTVIVLCAWAFYIADRLMDARSGVQSLRARHHFHWRYRRIFLPVAVAAALTALALVLHSMPLAARERNSFLAAAALAYFTSVHNPWRARAPKLGIPKELLVGVLFATACAMPALARAQADRLTLSVPVLIFIALAWLNCHAIETWESEPSNRQPAIFHLAIVLASVALFAATVSATLHHARFAILLVAACVSAALLALLDRLRPSLTPIALRAAADLVLLTPLALLAMA